MAGRTKKAAAKAFLRPNMMEAAPKVVGRSFIRTGGALAAHGIVNKVFGGPAPMVTDLGRAAGAIPWLLGVGAELVFADDYLQAVGEGMSAIGGVTLFADNAPDQITSAVGLSGIGRRERSYTPYEEIQEGPYNPYSADMKGLAGDFADELIRELDAAAATEGIQGLGTLQGALSNLPAIQ